MKSENANYSPMSKNTLEAGSWPPKQWKNFSFMISLDYNGNCVA